VKIRNVLPVLRNIIANFFLSGSTELSTENRRRVILINGILLLGFFALSSAALSAIFARNIPLALMDGVFVFIDLGLLIWLRLRHSVRVVGIALTLLILLLFIFLLITGGDKNTGPLWLYLFPLFSFFLVGGRSAISLNLFLLVTTGVVLFVPGVAQTVFDGAFKGRFLGSLFVLTGITYIFEYSRKDAESKMLVAQKETDDIFRAIQEGLFLLNRRGDKFYLGSRFSNVVGKMLASTTLADTEFIPLLKAHHADLDEDGLAKYLALLFNESLDEEMLAELNPLKQIEGDNILSFTFYRVADLATQKIESVMCTIEDKSEEVKLQRELAAREQSDTQQTALLLQILYTNPKLLADFLETAGAYEREINEMLSNATTVDADLLDAAFRKVHTIKGDARALGLEAVGNRAHTVEEKIAELKKQDSVTGADLFPLVVDLGGLRQIFDTLRELTALIRAHRGKETVTSTTPLKDTLYNLVRQLKMTGTKEVQLDTALFDENRLPVRTLRLMQEVLIQMIRNSFVHGIEDVTERLRAGKKATGIISLELKTTGDTVALHYSDDGHGLDPEKLKAKAVEAGIAPADEIAAWEPKRIYALIFRKGLSTAESVGADAGRGIGMDIIQENVRQLKGRIKLRNRPGKGVEFIFEFAADINRIINETTDR
jgi:two-component system, chemotaxis family, sensor kinase CheA